MPSFWDDVLRYPPRYPGVRPPPPPPPVDIMSAKEEGEQEAGGMRSGNDALRSNTNRAADAWIAQRSRGGEEKLVSDSGVCDGFKVRTNPRNFFSVGKVFLVLWAEETGKTMPPKTFSKTERSYEEIVMRTTFGNKVFSKFRRFIVVRAGESSCSAIPIQTYSGKGVGKPGVNIPDHAIIYTHRPATPMLPNEEMARRHPPNSVPKQSDNCIKLDAMARFDYMESYRLPSFKNTCTPQYDTLSYSWGGDSALKTRHGREADIEETAKQRRCPNSWSTPDHIPEFIPAARNANWLGHSDPTGVAALHCTAQNGVRFEDSYSYFPLQRETRRDLDIATESIEVGVPYHPEWNKHNDLKRHEDTVHDNHLFPHCSLLFDRGFNSKRMAALQRVMMLVERWKGKTLSSLTPSKACMFIATLSSSCMPRAFGQTVGPAGFRSGNSSPLWAPERGHLIVHDSTGSDGLFIALLSGFLCELLVAYKLRPFDRYKSRAMGTCMLMILLICGFYASNMRQVVLFEWLGLNLTLVISAAFHASFEAGTADDDDEDDDGVIGEKATLLGKSG